MSFSHFISPSSLVRVPFIKSPFPAANTTQEVTLHGPIFLLLTSCLVMSSRVQTALNTQFITVFLDDVVDRSLTHLLFVSVCVLS